jgi:ERCC4-related helicase
MKLLTQEEKSLFREVAKLTQSQKKNGIKWVIDELNKKGLKDVLSTANKVKKTTGKLIKPSKLTKAGKIGLTMAKDITGIEIAKVLASKLGLLNAEEKIKKLADEFNKRKGTELFILVGNAAEVIKFFDFAFKDGKKMAEELTDFLSEAGVKVRYLHSDVDTLKRVELLRQLRQGVFDVLVGINLLREGLDLPEVSLVAILDADKEGFLRSATSLVQTIGRAARNINGEVHMYGDNLTDSMRKAIDETTRRREKQVAYNKKLGVDPQPLQKKIIDITDQIEREELDTAELIAELGKTKGRKATAVPLRSNRGIAAMAQDEILAVVLDLDAQMRHAASELQFELAARLRDEIAELKHELRQMKKAGHI